MPSERVSLRDARWFRDARLRAIAYQVLIVGAVVLSIVLLVLRARERLTLLGVKTGFDFLANRAGFSIGEAPPLPVINGPLIALVTSLAIGLFGGVLLLNAATRRGYSALKSRNLQLTTAGVIVLPPLCAYLLVASDLAFFRFTPDHSLAQALLVGMANTLIVSAIALVFSTLLGVFGAILRLSRNRLLNAIGVFYIEAVRNVPLLLHLFFWYFGVLRALPAVRQSLSFGDMVFLNNRGAVLPSVSTTAAAWPFLIAVSCGVAFVVALNRVHRRAPAILSNRAVIIASVGGVIVPALLCLVVFGSPIELVAAELRGFNFRGGVQLAPEFVTLVVALSIYHGAYNAEIIRSGILSVPPGQTEAAAALGLRAAPIFVLIVAPLALRLIIPPLISRYMGLLKSSSLAVAIGYPELVSIGNSITYATGQAIEVVTITMLFYLSMNLAIAFVMNWYNARLQVPSGV